MIKQATKIRFGEWLISHGIITEEQLNEAFKQQRLKGERIGQLLCRLKLMSEKQMVDYLAQYLGVETINLSDHTQIDSVIARSIPENIAKKHRAVAIRQEGTSVVVAMVDPLDIVALDTIRQILKREVEIKIALEYDIQQAIHTIYHGMIATEQRMRDFSSGEADADADADRLLVDDLSTADIGSESAAGKAPVIQFVDLMLRQAVNARASDIHIEPQETSMVIRMRVDGALRDMVPPPRKMQAAVITRVKIMSKMNIAERRLPQDGRFKIKNKDADIDVRVSSTPTIYGEKIVMRILDASSVSHDIDELGLEPDLLRQFKVALSQPHGIIIVTGPTGSGKSTTLYSALSYLKDPRKNITTVEDPVEYRLKGINQIQTKNEIGLDFAASLRSILRQDPDIIMIGEMRDKETVEIATKASLTGHLVLSTFHTNDAASALSRLQYMGIEPYLLASTLNLVVAQRLLRKVCEYCKKPMKLSEELLRRFKLDPEQADQYTIYKEQGCGICDNTGYQGRIAVFEFLPLNQELRTRLVEGISEGQIREIIRQKGYSGLMESGVHRMLEGVTTAEEVLSVSFAEDLNI